MKKPTKKQVRKQQAKLQRKQKQISRRQASLRAKDELWHEMRPLLVLYDVRDPTEDEWIDFATHVMHDATALYDEPEFEGLLFQPAEAMYMLLREFDAHVPPPDELEKLPEAEQSDLMTEASIHAIVEFVSPELQRDVLSALGECRQRLKRAKQSEKLALAAAVEMLLRDDAQPVIWATCGIFHQALQASLKAANEFEEAKEKALKAAQAIQPDVKEIYDLEEGSPADLAFWEAVDKTPGLDDYLDAWMDIEEEAMSEREELDADLAGQLFEPAELDEILEGLVADLKAQSVDLSEFSDEGQAAETIVARLPEFLKGHISAERFQQLVDDLDELIEQAEENDPKLRRAEDLHLALSDAEIPYWQNGALQQFVFDALVARILENAEELDDEDEDSDDDAA
jgi:hypothetical protein